MSSPKPLSRSRDARDSEEGTWPRTIFLTFQFYRFPPVTTPRLQLLGMDGGTAAQLLLRVNKDGTLSTGKLWLRLLVQLFHQADLGSPQRAGVCSKSKPAS